MEYLRVVLLLPQAPPGGQLQHPLQVAECLAQHSHQAAQSGEENLYERNDAQPAGGGRLHHHRDVLPAPGGQAGNVGQRAPVGKLRQCSTVTLYCILYIYHVLVLNEEVCGPGPGQEWQQADQVGGPGRGAFQICPTLEIFYS